MKPLGRLGVAKRRRRAQPDVSFGWIAQQMPIRQDADREQYLEGFRRAGLDWSLQLASRSFTAPSRSTETSCDTPRSAMVTP